MIVVEKLTEVPVHTVEPGVGVIAIVGIKVLVMMIVADPVILLVQPVVAFIASTTYVPAAVCKPKSRTEPVPATGLPTAVVPLYN